MLKRLLAGLLGEEEPATLIFDPWQQQLEHPLVEIWLELVLAGLLEAATVLPENPPQFWIWTALVVVMQAVVQQLEEVELRRGPASIRPTRPILPYQKHAPSSKPLRLVLPPVACV